jgi:hypothetical protein
MSHKAYLVLGSDAHIADELAHYDPHKKAEDVTDEDVHDQITEVEFATEAELTAFLRGFDTGCGYLHGSHYKTMEEALGKVRSVVADRF